MKERKRLFIVLVILCMTASIVPVSQVQAETLEQRHTPSGIAYEDLQREIMDFIEERKEGCASVSAEVFDHDKTLCKVQYGCRDVENKIPVDQDTVYEWGSVSKLLVWTSVMQLYEQGKIDLNKDVREYLPDGFLTKRSDQKPVTMIDLMNHTAGWQETVYDTEVKEKSKLLPLEDALKKSEPAQIYPTGEVTAYSNWGAALAALIVERISGEDYAEYVQEHIFQPLHMTHTSVSADGSDQPWVSEQRKLLKCYSITQDSFEAFGNAVSYILLYPCGSAMGTLEDFATFGKAFTMEDSPLFQDQNTLVLMKSATSSFGDSEIARNCHGLWTLQYKEDVMGHSGNTTGCTSMLMFEPKSGLGIVVMTNEVGETAFCYGLLSLLYGDYTENARIVDHSFQTSEDMSGIYTNSRTFDKGFLRIQKYMGQLLFLGKTENSNQFKVKIVDGTLTKAAENQYVMDNGNGWRYLMYQTTNRRGTKVLQMMAADIVKESTIGFILKVASAVLMLLIVLCSVIGLLKGWIVSGYYRIRKKEPPKKDNSRWFYRYACVVHILIGILFYGLILYPLSEGTVKPVPVMIQCSLMGILSLYPLLQLIGMIRYWMQNRVETGKKVRNVIVAGASLYLSFFIWYWQLFQFWKC